MNGYYYNKALTFKVQIDWIGDFIGDLLVIGAWTDDWCLGIGDWIGDW